MFIRPRYEVRRSRAFELLKSDGQIVNIYTSVGKTLVSATFPARSEATGRAIENPSIHTLKDINQQILPDSESTDFAYDFPSRLLSCLIHQTPAFPQCRAGQV